MYLKTDVFLLADVFGNLRSVCMEIYGIDSQNYYIAPRLASDSMIKITQLKLELLT